MPLTQLSPRRLVGSLLAAGVCATGLVACGGDDAPTATAASGGSSSGSAGDSDAGRVRLQTCLRENGIDIPTQGLPPANLDRDKLQKALDGPCKKQQEAAFGDVSATDREDFQDAFAAFSSCMRKQGVDVPDITAGGGPPTGGAQIDMNDPKVQAAQKACQDKLPQGGPGGVPGGR